MRQPVSYFFRQRLGVMFAEAAVVGEDEEPFALNALQRYQLEDMMLDDSGEPEPMADVRANLTERAEQLGREGRLPIGLIGKQEQAKLVDALVPVRTAWLELCARYPLPAPKLPVSLEFGGVVLEDWVDQLRSNGTDKVWLAQISSKAATKSREEYKGRGDKLILMWLRQLAAAAQGESVTGYLVARDAIVKMAPLELHAAREALARVVAIWRDGMNRPLPTACKTGLALVQGGDPRTTYDGGFEVNGENEDLCLARLWPDFAALAAEVEWADVAQELYGPLAEWMAQQITITPIAGEDE
jgi:exodeoxyribonuclease V gamma subunit